MGADGGICWVRVKDRQKFRKLVSPFCLLWDGGDSHDHYHLDYLDKYPLPTDYEISRYSNLGRCNMGLMDLDEMLKDIEYWIEDNKKGLFDPYFKDANVLEMTWVDLLEDYYTSPDSTHWGMPHFVRVIVREVGFWFTSDILHKWPGLEIFKMTVGNWYQEVISCIYRDTFGDAETWT